MARKVFFSFHYERDAWRAANVRNCNSIYPYEKQGFIDSVSWESLKKSGDDAIRRWIRNQLYGTSVTVVLIGKETYSRQWVKEEIEMSIAEKKGLLGVYINKVEDKDSSTDIRGQNPLDIVKLPNGKPASTIYKTYDFVDDDGRNNLSNWIEEAAEAGR